MDDLISREAVRLALAEVDIPKSVIETEFYDVMSNIVDRLIAVPSVDAVPVKHGLWEESEEFKGYKGCSVCDNWFVPFEDFGDGKWAFCPMCGAKMDLEDKK